MKNILILSIIIGVALSVGFLFEVDKKALKNIQNNEVKEEVVSPVLPIDNENVEEEADTTIDRSSRMSFDGMTAPIDNNREELIRLKGEVDLLKYKLEVLEKDLQKDIEEIDKKNIDGDGVEKVVKSITPLALPIVTYYFGNQHKKTKKRKADKKKEDDDKIEKEKQQKEKENE